MTRLAYFAVQNSYTPRLSNAETTVDTQTTTHGNVDRPSVTFPLHAQQVSCSAPAGLGKHARLLIWFEPPERGSILYVYWLFTGNRRPCGFLLVMTSVDLLWVSLGKSPYTIGCPWHM